MARPQEQFKKTLGNRITTAQEAKGISDEEFRKALDCESSEIQMYKAGLRMPSLYRGEQIADTLGVSIDYLIGKTNSPMPVA